MLPASAMPVLADRPLLLTEPAWRARQGAHVARVQAWIGPHLERAARGEKHPVWDFLFHYYAFRPSWLRRWHPLAPVAFLTVMTGLLVRVCYAKGEPPSWRWGDQR